MAMTFEQLVKEMEAVIEDSYTNGVTLDEAERLAGRFLHAQMQVSAELKNADLDSRMKKSGVKALRAAVYLEANATKAERKLTEAAIAAMVDSHEIIQAESNLLDTSESTRSDLERYYDIFSNAHVHFRTIAKGRFES